MKNNFIVVEQCDNDFQEDVHKALGILRDAGLGKETPVELWQEAVIYNMLALHVTGSALKGWEDLNVDVTLAWFRRSVKVSFRDRVEGLNCAAICDMNTGYIWDVGYV